MNRQELTELLVKYRLRPDKRLGQHYLIDESVYEAIIKAADIHADELVVEIGAGPGGLTKALAKAGAEVLAVEFDRDFCRLLGEEFNNWRNVHVLGDDALRLDFTDLRKQESRSKNQENQIAESVISTRMGSGGEISNLARNGSEISRQARNDSSETDNIYRKMVANIPYQITNPLIRKILAPGSVIEIAILLIQKEVADRLMAKPGSADRGILTVYVEYYGTIEKVLDVPPEAFWPEPKVDSMVIKLTKQTDPSKRLLTEMEEKGFFWFVKQGFSGKRKKLPNSLSGGLDLSKSQTVAIVERAGVSVDLRAEDLSIEQWVALFLTYSHDVLHRP